MRGKFGTQGQPQFEIELISTNSQILAVDVWLDTGFTGWLAIDQQDAQSLGWRFLGRQNDVLTAGGYADFEIYQGIVLFDGERFEVTVLGGIDLPEILIGLAWLQTRRLVIDMPTSLLTLAAP